jgi:RNA polymerase primary sigma factor
MSKIFVKRDVIIATAESTKQYMNEIKRFDLISKEKEKELADRISKGDTAAVNELVTANLKFVAQVARQYQGMGVALEDLIAFGNIGLFEAATRFKANKGVKFISFAVWYIRAELQKALNDHARTVRIPSHRTATEEYSVKSIHDPIGDDEDSESYADRFLQADNGKSSIELDDLKMDIARAIAKLKPKEAQALKLFYGIDTAFPQPMEEIAKQMDIGAERARQLVRSAEINLKKTSGIKLLEQYL